MEDSTIKLRVEKTKSEAVELISSCVRTMPKLGKKADMLALPVKEAE